MLPSVLPHADPAPCQQAKPARSQHGASSRTPGGQRARRRASRTARAASKNPDPPDTPKDLPRRGGGGRLGSEWLQTIVSYFGPITEKAPNTQVLDFEKPLVELDNRIKEVRKVAEENGVDVTEQIQELEERARQLRKDTYERLTPVQRLQVARHANRPTFLDIALNISDKFVELHGDRAGLDDPAVVCGLASIDGVSFMFIGHQKGRNTKENIYRNFGMPQPNGYRKALRFMRHADKFGFPIITFVDTPGAYAGKKAEELGQGEAIAVNLREMFGLRVPVISVVIGEGGSGGALAIGCANYNLILEHSVYYVASPEACAAILWKSREKAGTATEALRITAQDLVSFGVMDDVVREPLGGAHADPMRAFPYIKDAIMAVYNQKYAHMTDMEVQLDRYAKFRKLGLFEEFLVTGGQQADALSARNEAPGAWTRAGTWAATEEEAKMVEMLTDRDEAWAELVADKGEWVNRPLQPPGLARTGILQVAWADHELRGPGGDAVKAAIEERRRQRRHAVARVEPSALPSEDPKLLPDADTWREELGPSPGPEHARQNGAPAAPAAKPEEVANVG